jgi:hypothetical protein
LLCEPVRATIRWQPAAGKVTAFALDNAGRRLGPVPIRAAPEGFTLELDGTAPGVHWELVRD